MFSLIFVSINLQHIQAAQVLFNIVPKSVEVLYDTFWLYLSPILRKRYIKSTIHLHLK